MPSLAELGWNDDWARHFEPYRERGWQPARVVLEHQHIYRVSDGAEEHLAMVPGRFRHRAERRQDYPAVGDWVAVEQRPGTERRIIQAVLPRTSKFSRKVAGDLTLEQVVAANIDTVFIVAGLDHDFNVRRLERYLVTAWEGGARPVILLNKADLCDDPRKADAEVSTIAPGVPVHTVSCKTPSGLDPLERYLQPRHTIALLGSSGVGKSTIINRLVGRDVRRTTEVRASDSRGRHTTSSRELVVLPGGSLLIDTPGMRELQLWEGAGSIDDTFDDIRDLAASCFFRDCRHDDEPKCAVKEAVSEGRLSAGRLDHYLRLQRELAHLAAKQDKRTEAEEKRKWRGIHKSLRSFSKEKR